MTLTPFETVVLEAGESRAVLAPPRGGILTRLTLQGRELLFLDEATLLDPSKNIRGGNPVLFPSPGPLVNERFEYEGVTGTMKQHGFARQLPWTVDSVSKAEAKLSLTSDATTLAQYPWPFRIAFRYALTEASLRIEQNFQNTGTTPMPFAAGFHPYFRVADADKAVATIPTRSTQGFDNVTKTIVPVEGPIDLTANEVDLHLIDHGSSEAQLDVAKQKSIAIRCSSEFQRWVVWTLKGKDFVCVEPWTAAANALNTQAQLTVVAPGETYSMWTEYLLR